MHYFIQVLQMKCINSVQTDGNPNIHKCQCAFFLKSFLQNKPEKQIYVTFNSKIYLTKLLPLFQLIVEDVG